MNPWLTEKNPKILRRAGKTGEEASELCKVCFRISIQGIDGVDPKDGKPNRQALAEECVDVVAQALRTLQMLEDEGMDMTFVEVRIERKTQQMDEWEALVAPLEA